MKKEAQKNQFLQKLKEQLNAEEQLANALPNMLKAAEAHELHEAFKSHLAETKEHVKRLRMIFAMLGVDGEGASCDKMVKLIHECDKIMSEHQKSEHRDEGLITKACAIERYEITTYESLQILAGELGLAAVQNLLQENLDEEMSAEKALNKIAENTLLTA